MENIVLTRIDDRLIHGQVVTAWVKHTDCNRILVVDDAVAADPFMQRLLKAAAPPKLEVLAQGVQEASRTLAEGDGGTRTMVLVKTPATIEQLQEAGVSFDKVILGGMGSSAGRKKFNKNVSASEDEIDCMKRIMQRGTTMQYQLVPDESPVDVAKLV